ncbi:Uncharacterised protein [Vibrio cholerae]|nr:Uncharacterised protein [Vibrio cholerae]CSI47425.1 Uncharacterised protein [Vibrio cholerae]
MTVDCFQPFSPLVSAANEYMAFPPLERCLDRLKHEPTTHDNRHARYRFVPLKPK